LAVTVANDHETLDDAELEMAAEITLEIAKGRGRDQRAGRPHPLCRHNARAREPAVYRVARPRPDPRYSTRLIVGSAERMLAPSVVFSNPPNSKPCLTRRGFFFGSRRYTLDPAPTVEVEAPTMHAILLALILMLSVAACHDPNSHPYDYMPEGSSDGGR
jgi:hypothetical protein